MQKQSIESYSDVNPLVGLSAKTLRLYSALEVFRGKTDSLEEPEWFRTPNRDAILSKVGLSKTDIHIGITELIDADLLQIEDRNRDLWYCLK